MIPKLNGLHFPVCVSGLCFLCDCIYVCVNIVITRSLNFEEEDVIFFFYLNLGLRFWKDVGIHLRGEECNSPRIKAQKAQNPRARISLKILCNRV
jgi:hypothetical protein